jgi:hypothetical protein
MFCYNNNGFGFRAVDSDYVAQTGEVLFNVMDSTDVTESQLLAAFSGRVTAIKQQKLDEVNTKYDTILNDLGIKYSLAAGSDGTTVTAKQTVIQNQILAQIAEKATERSAILNG